MSPTPRFWRRLAVVLGATCLLGLLPTSAFSADDFNFKDKALAAEKGHDWLEACRCYDKALRKDRNQPESARPTGAAFAASTSSAAVRTASIGT